MNILYCDRFEIRSLSSIHVYELFSNLLKLGHNVVLLNTNGLRNKPGPDANLQLVLRERIKNILRSLPLFKLLQGEITILWIFSVEIRIFLSTFIAIMKHKRKFDVIYRRHNLFNTEYFLAKLFRIPSVKEVNGIVADEMRIGGKGDRVSVWFMDRIEKWNMPRADKIIGVSAQLEEVLHNEYNVPEDRIVVILNGANTELFKPMDAAKAKDELGLRQSDSYVCFVGSLSKWQGVEYLIEAAPLILESYPNTRFLIVGDGVMKEELIQLTEQVGVSDKVIFTGMMPYKKIPLYINASDICVLPKKPLRSGYSPLKLCEYMACQKPVVASSISGLEILESYNAGILVLPESPQALASAIIKLLQDPELREQMGENGRKYVVENRSWESVAKKVAEVCEQTLEERRNKMR